MKPLDEAMRRAAKEMANKTRHTSIADDVLEVGITSLARDGWLLQQGWQPIETAPVNWVDVIVCGPDDARGEARHIPGEGWYWAGEFPGDYGACPFRPTHWMPMPAAPKVTP